MNLISEHVLLAMDGGGNDEFVEQPAYDSVPTEDRSKYEKLDDDFDDDSDGEDDDMITPTPPVVLGDQPCNLSDNDSIGSASDLHLRNDDDDDFPQKDIDVLTTTQGSSVYHAECESVTTHESDQRRAAELAVKTNPSRIHAR